MPRTPGPDRPPRPRVRRRRRPPLVPAAALACCAVVGSAALTRADTPGAGATVQPTRAADATPAPRDSDSVGTCVRWSQPVPLRTSTGENMHLSWPTTLRFGDTLVAFGGPTVVYERHPVWPDKVFRDIGAGAVFQPDGRAVLIPLPPGAGIGRMANLGAVALDGSAQLLWTAPARRPERSPTDTGWRDASRDSVPDDTVFSARWQDGRWSPSHVVARGFSMAFHGGWHQQVLARHRLVHMVASARSPTRQDGILYIRGVGDHWERIFLSGMRSNFYAQLAVLRDSTIVVAYARGLPGGNSNSLVAARYGWRGEPLGEPTVVYRSEGNEAHFARLLTDRHDHLHLVWLRRGLEPGVPNMAWAASSDGGRTWHRRNVDGIQSRSAFDIATDTTPDGTERLWLAPGSGAAIARATPVTWTRLSADSGTAVWHTSEAPGDSSGLDHARLSLPQSGRSVLLRRRIRMHGNEPELTSMLSTGSMCSPNPRRSSAPSR